MATTTKVVAIGSSIGVVLPKEMLARLNVQKGDTLYVRSTASGLELSPYNEESGVEGKNRRYRDAYKKLTG